MGKSTVFVVDDDPVVRAMVAGVAESAELQTEGFGSALEFLAAFDPDRPGCLVLDVRLPGISGLDLQARLRARHIMLPIIMVTGFADVTTAVRALRAGALDFLEKPLSGQALLERINEAVGMDRHQRQSAARFADFSARVVKLTPRERQVLTLIVEGRANRQIAEALVLSRKTVETHRANLISKTGVESLAELIRFGLQMGVPADRLPSGPLWRGGGWPPGSRTP
jgi:FixJ family two-component response regulator